MLSNGDVDNTRPGLLVLPVRLHRWTTPAAAAVLRTSPTTRRSPSPDLADGPAEDLRRRQDGDGQDQARASSSARRSTARSPRRTSSTRSSAASCRRSANGYASAYFGDIIGRPRRTSRRQGQGDHGHQTPDEQTIVHQARPAARAAIVIGALALPASAPVPKEYAAKYDAARSRRSTAAPGRDRPVHDPERRRAARSPATSPGKSHHARAQPELGQVDRLPPGLPRQDRRSRRATTRPSRNRKILQRPEHGATGDFAAAAGDPQATSTGAKKSQLISRRRPGASATSRSTRR